MTENATIDAFAHPGYRRRIRVEPGVGMVSARLEDDVHAMAVILRHAEGRVIAVEAEMERAPWTTCPGAVPRLGETFDGLLLSEVTARREKRENCTHLHDLAVLAAAHSGDDAPTTFDIAATDPVSGLRVLEIRRNGACDWRWTEQDDVLTAPAVIAGLTLLTLRDWIATLVGSAQESARMLQWSSLVAHGRTMDFSRQSEASALPANCYTLQPERAAVAQRNEKIIDFSAPDARELLER